MADVSISIGNVKMKDSPRIPVTLRLYALTDFNLADGTPIQASSPYNGGNAYKSVALTPTGTDPTVYAWGAFTVPATEDAAVNPNTARWGFFLFDGSTTPRLITHVSGLASARVPATPTPTTLSALALYNGGSLAPVVVNVAVSGTLTVGGVATFNGAVVMNGTLNGQGIIGGAGVTDRISYWTDADTLASSPFLRIGSDEVEQRGSNGANKLHISAGYTDASNWTKASIDATTAVVIYGVTQLGSATGVPVRLASYNDGVVQFGDHDNVWWEMSEDMLLPKVADFAMVGHPDFPITTFSASIGIGNGFRFCSGQTDVAGLEYGGLVGVIKASGGGAGRGTIQIGDTLEAKPTADIATRGLFWFDQGGAGVADTVEIVRKTAADVYEYADLLGSGGGVGYLVYRALLSQTGSGAPTAVVLENTLGGTVVWGYTSAGVYTATLTGAFPVNKVFPRPWIGQTNEGTEDTYWLEIVRTSDNVLTISKFRGNFNASLVNVSDELTSVPLEILVYP